MKNIYSLIFIISSISSYAMEFQKNNFEINAEEGISSNPQNKLYKAARYGKVEKITKLLALPIDINAKDRYGRTALITAAIYYRTKAARILLDAGADVDIKAPESTTAIFYACNWGDLELINELLAKKADPNSCMNSDEYSSCAGMSPLITFARSWNSDFQCYKQTMENLLNAKANTQVVDSFSHTVDHYIELNPNFSKEQKDELLALIQESKP